MTGFDSYLESGEASRDDGVSYNRQNNKCKLTFSIRASGVIFGFAVRPLTKQ